MQLSVLGLISKDTLLFFDGRSYVGGGALATAWVSSLWNMNTILYSISSNAACNRVISNNLSVNADLFTHTSLAITQDIPQFSILQDGIEDEYSYSIKQLPNANTQLLHFLASCVSEKYIKLPAKNFNVLGNYAGDFSANPQGNFNLAEYCDIIKTTGYFFLNEKELLSCSRMTFQTSLEYIEGISQSFVITLGRRGAICYTAQAQMWWFCPSIYVKDCISTLGCGDAFAGGFLAANSQKKSIGECLVQGTISAYCATQSPGNMVTRWLDKNSIERAMELEKHVKHFNTARELCDFLQNNTANSIFLDLYFDINIGFRWLFG